MSDSVRSHRQQPTRILCPWDSPGKNTGVGCHFLLQCMKVKSESKVAQSCPTPCDPMDFSLPGSSIHGIFQARVPEGGAIAFSNDHYTRIKIIFECFKVCKNVFYQIDHFLGCGDCSEVRINHIMFSLGLLWCSQYVCTVFVCTVFA